MGEVVDEEVDVVPLVEEEDEVVAEVLDQVVEVLDQVAEAPHVDVVAFLAVGEEARGGSHRSCYNL